MRILRWARPVGLVAVVAVAVMAFAGGATAGAPTFSGTLGSNPSGVSIAYSQANGPTSYVQYVTTFSRTSSDTSALTHATISEPVIASNLNAVPGYFPGQIVSLSSSPTACIPTYRDNPNGVAHSGVSCDFGTLRQGAVITLTVVVQMPAGSVDSSFGDLSALTVKEGGSDSQPQSSYTDTFFTGGGPSGTPLVTTLTSDTSSALNTFTLPNTAGNFQTSGNGLQLSSVSWAGTTGFPGGALQLKQCGGNGTACDSGTPSPCPSKCGTQTSIVTVPGSGSSFFQVNPLTIILVFSASDLPSKFVLSQFTIYHDGSPVSSCKKTPLTDPSGDCLSSLTQNKSTGAVTAIITGPANGGWGGAG
jgi:hypothetical protein